MPHSRLGRAACAVRVARKWGHGRARRGSGERVGHAQPCLSMCGTNRAGIRLRFRESLLLVIRFGCRLLGGRGRCGCFGTPVVRIGLDPLIPRVAHARIEGKQVALTLLNRRG